MIRYSQAMPTFVVDDQLLLRDIVGCVLCAFAQRAYQLVVHDKEACTHRTATRRGYFERLLDPHGVYISPVQKRFPGYTKNTPPSLPNTKNGSQNEFENHWTTGDVHSSSGTYTNLQETTPFLTFKRFTCSREANRRRKARAKPCNVPYIPKKGHRCCSLLSLLASFSNQHTE